MTPDSFTFGSYNSVDDWGIYVVTYDVILPPKRIRKITIPRKSGQYKFRGDVWDERLVRISCTLQKKISRAQLREIAYYLSHESQLILWEEPDKYYIGELYDAHEIIDYYDEAMRDFEITFTCHPFAYSSPQNISIATGNNNINYLGTADAPCVIVLRNNNDYEINNIMIKLTYGR